MRLLFPLPRALGPTASQVAAHFVPRALVVLLHNMLLCRFFNTSELLARFLRCRRPLFFFDGQVKQRQVELETTHPVPQASLVGVVSRYPCEPRTPRKVSSAFAPSSRCSHKQSCPVRLRMKAYGNRRDFFSSIQCSGAAICGELSAAWRDGPRWGSTWHTRVSWSPSPPPFEHPHSDPERCSGRVVQWRTVSSETWVGQQRAPVDFGSKVGRRSRT